MLGNKKVMGDNIQYYLSKTDIERKDFAKIIGVPYSTLTTWINGEAYPRIDKIQAMADYFGVKKSALVEERGTFLGDLTNEEKAIILLYRSADPARRAIIRELLENAQRKVDE